MLGHLIKISIYTYARIDFIKEFIYIFLTFGTQFSPYSLNIFYCQIFTAMGLGHKFSQHLFRSIPYILDKYNSL